MIGSLAGRRKPEEAPYVPVGELLPSQPITDKRLLRKNFIYYHKWHMLIGAAILAAAVSFVVSVATKVKPDASVAVIGEFPLFTLNQEVFERELLEVSPEFKAISVDSAIELGPDADPQMASAMVMKRMVLVAAADVDVYICDGEFFTQMAAEGLFEPFDEVASLGGFSTQGLELALSGGVAYGALLMGAAQDGGGGGGLISAADGVYRDGPGIGGLLGGGAQKIACLSVKASKAEQGARLIAALLG